MLFKYIHDLQKNPHRFPSLNSFIYCASQISGWITETHVTKAQRV